MASGRIRTIKPELLEDEKTAGLSDQEFRLFVGLLLLSDDYGNFRASPNWLAGQVFWLASVSTNTRECLASLSRVGLVSVYEVSGQVYGHVCGWSKHQKIDRPSKARIPGPELGKPAELSPCRIGSRESRESLATDRDLDLDQGSGSEDHLHSTSVEVPAPVPVKTEPLPASGPKPKRTRKPVTEGSPEHAQVVAAWFSLFEKAKGTKPIFNGGKDGRAVKTLLDAFGRDVEKITAAMRNAFADAWWAQNRATLSDLASNPNRFLTAPLPQQRARGAYPVQGGNGGVAYLESLRLKREANALLPDEPVLECVDV